MSSSTTIGRCATRRARRKTRWTCALLVGALAMPATVVAQPVPPEVRVDRSVAAGLAEMQAEVHAHPNDMVLLARYGLRLILAGRSQDGLAAITRAVSRKPHEPRVRLLQAKSYSALDRHAEASDAAEEVMSSPLATREEKAEACFVAGTARSRLGDMVEAERLLEQAIRLDPEHGPAMMNLGVLQLARDRRREALTYLARAARAAPDNPRLQGSVAGVLEGLGRYGEALPLRERVVELVPDDAGARVVLARLYLRQRNLDEAAEHLARAVELAPRDADSRVAYAQVLLQLDRHELALEHAREAEKLGAPMADRIAAAAGEALREQASGGGPSR
jgi:tetratricopeptide (TPR) repeat protein